MAVEKDEEGDSGEEQSSSVWRSSCRAATVEIRMGRREEILRSAATPRERAKPLPPY